MKNVFLYGRSGSGKSRTMLEIISSDLINYEKIYLINPSKVLGENAFREDIYDLRDQFNDGDAVIWDNFPLDLVRRDRNNAREALEVFSLTHASKVIISLNPRYPEAYRKICSDMPEIFSQEVVYTKDNIKKILKIYGTRIDSFREVYQKNIEKDLDPISTILWNKEPTPLIVLEYYKRLTMQSSQLSHDSLNAVFEAGQLRPMIDFYEKQFKYLRESEARISKINLHFLYTLKLCYELGLDRGLNVLKELQKAIFQSYMPTEPAKDMSSWIYLSGQYYSMHDIAREAIQFSPDILLKVTNHLKDNPEVMFGGDDNTLYLASIFIGKNIQYLYSKTSPFLLPPKFNILTHRGEQRLLKLTELCQEFEGHSPYDHDFQTRLIDISNNYKDPFGHGLGLGLGQIYPSLSQETRDNIWKRLLDLFRKNLQVGFGFGEGVAQVFPSLNQETRNKLWIKVLELCMENQDFAAGFGENIAYVVEHLNKSDFENIVLLAENNDDFAMPLGMFCARKLQSLQQDIQLQERIMGLIKRSPLFAAGLGSILGENFAHLDDNLQKILLEEAKINEGLAFGLGRHRKENEPE